MGNVMTAKNYQMFWDCGHCGTKKLLGVTHRHCPNCGSAQDENKRYFPAPGEEVELHDHIYYGVDWDCPYCSTPNSKNSNNCCNCGGPKAGSVDVDLVGQPKVAKQDKVKNTSDEITQQRNTYSHQPEPVSVKKKKDKADSNQVMMIIAGVIFAFLIGFLIYGYNKVTPYSLTVNAKTWSRSIDIEEYRSISDTDWCSSMPYDAYNVSRYRDIRSHRQVADGQTCSTQRRDRGDGSYSSERVCQTKYRSEPVYDDKCSYRINRWRFSNSLMASGDGNSQPHYPDVSQYSSNPPNILGNKRTGSRSERYTVHFTYEDEDKKVIGSNCGYNQGKWTQFQLYAHHNGQVRMIGGLICNEVLTEQEQVVANTKLDSTSNR